MKGKHPLQKTTRHVPPSTPSLPHPHTKSHKLPAHPSKPRKPATHPPKPQAPSTHPSNPKSKAPRTPKHPKKPSMPKPTPRKKTPRYLRSRNWRERSSAFSEDSIQRQLNYLVPRCEEPGCCWHACPWEGFVWCCGWTCWDNDNGGEERGGEKDGEGGGGGGGGVRVEVESLEKKVDRPLRGLCRDEWECDFCGAECFCEWVLGK